ncbi:hypothetical protein, partial [Komagataeibacter oboediens]|uniref:hypothetical protein n=1 Tax=Komagataeibacter oboediens TaxID=65958 RepID=UPI001902E538
MATEDVVRSMRARMPWNVAQRVLKAAQLHRSQGWKRTLARVTAGDEHYDAREEELKDALTQHLLCGEKIVRFFELTDEEISSLRESSHALQVPEGPFQAMFPILLDEADLKTVNPPTPTLVSIMNFEDGSIALVLASRRHLEPESESGLIDFSQNSADMGNHQPRV